MKFTEKEIIERIKKLSPSTGEKLVKGIGDDCAIINLGNGILELISTDTLVEKVHFGSWHPPELLGRKAAAVNLSDVAAMGGLPKYCLLSLAISDGTDNKWLDEFIGGFLAMLSGYNVDLVGGDTVRSPDLTMISVTVIGHSDENRVLKRSTAKNGDIIMVSGNLGDAAAGLKLCQIGKDDSAEYPELLKAHLDPYPEIDLGVFLAETGRVNAMIDMSDGLATDLAHICIESGCGAEVDCDLIPVSEELKRFVKERNFVTKKFVLSGGEDYKLLFTVPPGHVDDLVMLVKKEIGRDIYKIGRVVEGQGVVLLEEGNRHEIGFQGYDHFG